jgi:hypothetical protein
MKCPICSHRIIDEITKKHCYKFDQSYLYNVIRIVCCRRCGHIFNHLTKKELKNLKKYYSGEYQKSNSNSLGKRMDLVRSEQLKNLKDTQVPIIIYDQELEHIYNLDQIFQGFKNILKRGECVWIGVPDASRYEDYKFFPHYWIILREHIQHFDLEHIQLLADLHGFDVELLDKSEMPIMSDKMIMPVLTVSLRYTKKRKKFKYNENLFTLKQKMLEYIKDSNIDITSIPKNKKICFWGMGREFLYVYNLFNSFKDKILIDNNKYKQDTLTIEGIPINDESLLETLGEESVIVITATAHTNKLKAKLSALDYKGTIFEL